jgi:hypothetical protein
MELVFDSIDEHKRSEAVRLFAQEIGNRFNSKVWSSPNTSGVPNTKASRPMARHAKVTVTDC